MTGRIRGKIEVFLRNEFAGRGIVIRILIIGFLLAVSYVFLYPLMKMLSMSFMSEKDLINPEVDWIPIHVSLKSFRVAAKVLELQKTLVNSMWFTFVLASAQTVVSALTAYAFARYNFRFKGFWFVMMLVTFILPVPIVIIPRIMLFISIQEFTGLKMIGTVWPQLLTTLGGQGVFSAILILIFYNFFRLIPHSLDEAARIDGANPLQTFYHVILKLSVPTVFTVFLFSFLWNWNETYITTTFIRSSMKLLTLQLAVFDNAFQRIAGTLPEMSDGARINEAYKMAATFISIVPLLILYSFVQKKFIQGIEQTGISGE